MNLLQRAEQAKLDRFQNASNAAIYTAELEGRQEQQEVEEEEEQPASTQPQQRNNSDATWANRSNAQICVYYNSRALPRN